MIAIGSAKHGAHVRAPHNPNMTPATQEQPMYTISWFEIPTTELGRAVDFYQATLGVTLRAVTSDGLEMYVFPYAEGATGGCLVRHPQQAPAAAGTLVYFACDALPGGLDGCLERAAKAGGQVTLPRMAIGEHGFIGHVRDSEGNLIGLHAAR